MAVGICPFVQAHAAGEEPIVGPVRALRVDPADEGPPAGKPAGVECAAEEAELLAQLAIGKSGIHARLPIQPREGSAQRGIAAPAERRHRILVAGRRCRYALGRNGGGAVGQVGIAEPALRAPAERIAFFRMGDCDASGRALGARLRVADSRIAPLVVETEARGEQGAGRDFVGPMRRTNFVAFRVTGVSAAPRWLSSTGTQPPEVWYMPLAPKLTLPNCTPPAAAMRP